MEIKNNIIMSKKKCNISEALISESLLITF